MSRCKGCGKRIVWGTDEKGKAIPLDPSAPVYELEVPLDESEQPVKRTKTAMVSHFATCPDANKFSGGKKQGDLL